MIRPKACCYFGLNNLFFLVFLRGLRGQRPFLGSYIHNKGQIQSLTAGHSLNFLLHAVIVTCYLSKRHYLVIDHPLHTVRIQ